ncbi:MAG: hypothetical protein WC243_04320 [Patescibacteria group bacterium]|jgi:hypothetical protein
MEMTEIITKDLHLAAILVSYGSQIVSVDKKDPKRQHFHFDKLPLYVYICDNANEPMPERVNDLAEIKSYFISKKLFFPPNFLDCLRSVKSALFAE